MPNDTYDLAFVSPLEKVNARGETVGRPDDEECMIVRSHKQHLQQLLDVGQQVQKIQEDCGQDGEFQLTEVPFRVDLCYFPNNFREPHELSPQQEPTPFEAAIHHTMEDGLAGLLSVEIADSVVRKRGLYKDVTWPGTLSASTPSRFRMLPQPYSNQSYGTVESARFDTAHLLLGLLLTNMISPEEFQQRKFSHHTNFIFREMLTILQKAPDEMTLPARHWSLFLQRASTDMRRTALRLIHKQGEPVKLSRQQLTTLLQDQDQSIRQLASRLAGKMEPEQTPSRQR